MASLKTLDVILLEGTVSPAEVKEIQFVTPLRGADLNKNGVAYTLFKSYG